MPMVVRNVEEHVLRMVRRVTTIQLAIRVARIVISMQRWDRLFVGMRGIMDTLNYR